MRQDHANPNATRIVNSCGEPMRAKEQDVTNDLRCPVAAFTTTRWTMRLPIIGPNLLGEQGKNGRQRRHWWGNVTPELDDQHQTTELHPGALRYTKRPGSATKASNNMVRGAGLSAPPCPTQSRTSPHDKPSREPYGASFWIALAMRWSLINWPTGVSQGPGAELISRPAAYGLISSPSPNPLTASSPMRGFTGSILAALGQSRKALWVGVFNSNGCSGHMDLSRATFSCGWR